MTKTEIDRLIDAEIEQMDKEIAEMSYEELKEATSPERFQGLMDSFEQNMGWKK